MNLIWNVARNSRIWNLLYFCVHLNFGCRDCVDFVFSIFYGSRVFAGCLVILSSCWSLEVCLIDSRYCSFANSHTGSFTFAEAMGSYCSASSSASSDCPCMGFHTVLMHPTFLWANQIYLGSWPNGRRHLVKRHSQKCSLGSTNIHFCRLSSLLFSNFSLYWDWKNWINLTFSQWGFSWLYSSASWTIPLHSRNCYRGYLRTPPGSRHHPCRLWEVENSSNFPGHRWLRCLELRPFWKTVSAAFSFSAGYQHWKIRCVKSSVWCDNYHLEPRNAQVDWSRRHWFETSSCSAISWWPGWLCWRRSFGYVRALCLVLVSSSHDSLRKVYLEMATCSESSRRCVLSLDRTTDIYYEQILS